MPASAPDARSLLWPYALPYFAYVGLGSVVDVRTHPEALYAARLLGVGGALAFFWRRYLPLRGPKSPLASVAIGALVGLAATPVWLALRAPFAASAPAWTDSAWAARALGSTVLPPLVEELLFRGWALRVGVLFERARRAGSRTPLGDALHRFALADVAAGAWTPLALFGSSALFAAGHLPGEWPAALVYGAAMCALWIARGDLVSCISAHAVTNLALALYVRASGHWGSW